MFKHYTGIELDNQIILKQHIFSPYLFTYLAKRLSSLMIESEWLYEQNMLCFFSYWLVLILPTQFENNTVVPLVNNMFNF